MRFTNFDLGVLSAYVVLAIVSIFDTIDTQGLLLTAVFYLVIALFLNGIKDVH